MSAKRRPLDRRRRVPIGAETLALFARLENTPLRQRRTEEFEAQDYELHQQLGLSDERFCSQVSVLDRSAGPCHPPGYLAYDNWFVVRAVREQLLEAVRRTGNEPVAGDHAAANEASGSMVQ